MSRGAGFQNASPQIFVIENNVSKPTANAAATIAYCPARSPACTSESFAKNPDSGGIPASDIAGTRNSRAKSGCD